MNSLHAYRKKFSSPKLSKEKAKEFTKGGGVLNTHADKEFIEMFGYRSAFAKKLKRKTTSEN